MMNKDKGSDTQKEANRFARRYLPHRASKHDEMESLAFMFTRDLPLGLIPSRYSSKSGTFNIRLKAPDLALEKKLTSILDTENSLNNSLTESVEDFIETCVNYMSYWGDITFEILYSDEQRTQIKKLDPLPPKSMVKLPAFYLQLIPAEDVDESKKRYLILPAKHFLTIKLPKRLGTVRQHRRMIRRLNKLSASMPDFTFEGVDMGTAAGFSFDTHRLNKDVAIERTTRRFGTIPSLRQLKHTAEYYYIANSLRNTLAKALIREHIISELNKLLLRSGIDNNLVMEGVPASGEVEKAIQDLHAGKYGFKEALDIAKS